MAPIHCWGSIGDEILDMLHLEERMYILALVP